MRDSRRKRLAMNDIYMNHLSKCSRKFINGRMSKLQEDMQELNADEIIERLTKILKQAEAKGN